MAGSTKTKEEQEVLREGGGRLARILEELARLVRPGITTGELDHKGEELIFASGGRPSFKGYKIPGARTAYPASICASVNDEVVHAIPGSRVLTAGDIIGIDIGMQWPTKGGLYTDMAVTLGVGSISREAETLIRVTKEALLVGIKAARPGGHMGDIGHAVETHLSKFGYGIIRDLAGHGVGYAVHEDPSIPNYGKPGTGAEIVEGMVLAIEPMASRGDWRVYLAKDGWTFKTKDKSISAHFEHTILVAKGGAEVLTKAA